MQPEHDDLPQGAEPQGEDDGAVPKVDVREFLDEFEFGEDLSSYFDANLFSSFVKRQIFKNTLKKSKSLKDLANEASEVVSKEKEKLKSRGKKILKELRNDKIAKLLKEKKKAIRAEDELPTVLAHYR
jgi:hypothetical protein